MGRKVSAQKARATGCPPLRGPRAGSRGRWGCAIAFRLALSPRSRWPGPASGIAAAGTIAASEGAAWTLADESQDSCSTVSSRDLSESEGTWWGSASGASHGLPPLDLAAQVPSPASSTVCSQGARKRLAAGHRKRNTKLWEWIGVIALIGGAELYDSSLNTFNEAPIYKEAGHLDMPQPWDRRYLKYGGASGYEILLVRRGSRAGRWAAVLPNGDLGEIELNQRRILKAAPEAGIAYTPMPVLTEERRTEIDTEVARLLAAGMLRQLRREGAGFGTELRRFGAVFSSLPVLCGRWVRWALRSRTRFGGFCAIAFLLYEGLSHWGLFDWLQDKTDRAVQVYHGIQQRLSDSNEAFAELVQFWESIYKAVSDFVEPWRVVAYVGCAFFVYWFWRDTQDPKSTSSPASSASGSPGTSPEATPPASPRSQDNTLAAIKSAFENQSQLLQRMAERQESFEEKLADQMDSRRAAELLRDAKAERAPEPDMWERIAKRIDGFEEVLKADRHPADGAAGGSPQPRAGSAPEVNKSDVQQVIDKLKRTAERPHDTYLLVIAEYREVDLEMWATHFPIGYRERVAPTWLGEIYSMGTNGKTFAKNFIKERQLGDCGEAREIIPIMSAIDSMVLQDRTPGVINSVALERLCKRGFGIVSAYRSVERKEDWKKPQQNQKNWRSKVNEELWRRIDPARSGVDELNFTNRKLEEEIRSEVDRDAAMLKAFSKLEDRQKAGGGD